MEYQRRRLGLYKAIGFMNDKLVRPKVSLQSSKKYTTTTPGFFVRITPLCTFLNHVLAYFKLIFPRPAQLGIYFFRQIKTAEPP